MSEVLKKAGGTLIPLSTLVTPLPPQVLLQNSSPSPEVCPADVPSLEETRPSTAQVVSSPTCATDVNSLIGELIVLRM